MPPESVIRAMLQKEGAGAVGTALAAMGYNIPRHRLETLRSQMVANGEAKRIEQKDRGYTGFTIGDPSQTAATGSSKLQERIDRLYQRVAAERGCSIDAARIVLNYSPAQIARMAA